MNAMNRWFVVAKHGKWQGASRNPDWNPVSTLHAKEMGTRFTACGQLCESWPKWWGRPFRRFDEKVCGQCAQIVAQAEALDDLRNGPLGAAFRSGDWSTGENAVGRDRPAVAPPRSSPNQTSGFARLKS